MKRIIIASTVVLGCQSKRVEQPVVIEQPREIKPLIVTELIVEKNIEIDVHEVTVQQYEGCIVSGLCPSAKSEACEGNERPDQPKSCVNFLEAKAYCEAVGKRLPTISEIRTVTGKNRKVTCSSIFPTSGGDDGACDVRADLGLNGLTDNVSEWVTDDGEAGVWGGSWKSLSLEELTTFERTTPINRQATLGFRCAKDR